MDIMEGAVTACAPFAIAPGAAAAGELSYGASSSLVRPVSALLASSNVPILYHSTHCSDLVLVQGNKLSAAVDALRENPRFILEE
jgi:hypothetical protein